VSGASIATLNVITPLSSPLFVTPVLYALLVPNPATVFIQNGWPVAFMLNV